MSQITGRVTKIASTVAAPLTWVGEKAYARATIATRFYPSELQQQIATARVNGDDLAADCTSTFIQTQWQLVPYRIQKMKDELDDLKSGRVSLATLTYKEWIRNARFLARLLFVFMFGVMMGRMSIYPLIAPDSIFAQEMLKRPPGN